MISLFSRRLKRQAFMPVAYYYYNRANMHETTPMITSHSHSLHEIMYVSNGRVRIQIDGENIYLSRRQYIWLDANTHHILRVADHTPLSMLNAEYQFEPNDGRCISTKALYEGEESFQSLLDTPAPYLVITDEDEIVFHLLKQLNQLAALELEESIKLCSQLLMQILRITATLRL